MGETNTVVIARLDRATQYSRDGRVQPRGRGVLDRPVKPGDDTLVPATLATMASKMTASITRNSQEDRP
jgi:hypothetical protein